MKHKGKAIFFSFGQFYCISEIKGHLEQALQTFHCIIAFCIYFNISKFLDFVTCTMNYNKLVCLLNISILLREPVLKYFCSLNVLAGL